MILQNWSVADWLQVVYLSLTLLGIIVGGYIAVWVVRSLQRQLNNEQSLKDYFGKELIGIRDGYRQLLDGIQSESLKPVAINSQLKRLNRRLNDLMLFLNTEFEEDPKIFQKYSIGLLRIIEDDPDFSEQYKGDCIFKPSAQLVDKLMGLEADYSLKFHQVFTKIYRH